MIKSISLYQTTLAALFVLSLSKFTQAAVVPLNVTLSEKQQLVRNNQTEILSLDPHKTDGVPDMNISRDLFEGLLINDPTGKIQPGIAEHWDTQDSIVWTFYLRKNAKWSNGEPITAQDFVYSWRRLIDPATLSPYISYLQYAHLLNAEEIIQGKKPPETLGIKALDAHTVQITLSIPLPYLPTLLSHSTVSVLNPNTIEKFGDKWTQPENLVTSGAYKLKEWLVNEKIVLTRNPYYWNNAATIIDQVTFLPISSEIADFNRYRAGEIDITGSVPIDLFKKIQQDYPSELHTNLALCNYYYALNNAKPPLDDVRVRTALKLALDQNIIVTKVKQQQDVAAYSYTPPYTNGINLSVPDWFNWSQTQRNEEARRLLAEAGYGINNPINLTLLYNTAESHKKIGIAAASMWKKNLGVNIKLVNQEWRTYLETLRQGDYDIARKGWCADYNEPSAFLNTFLSDSSNSVSQYHSAIFDEIMAKTLLANNDAERQKLYAIAEQQLDQDSVVVPVYYVALSRLVKPQVGGYSDINPLNVIYTKDLYIIKQHK